MRTFLKNSSRSQLKGLRTPAVFLLCCLLLGCIGATPLPKRTRTPSGTEVKNVDLSFIHPGQTSRAEVQAKLRIIDTGYEGDHYFLGRWSSSTWGGWIVGTGTCCGTEVSGGRVWKTGNLLVEFDDQGIVKTVEPFSDGIALRVLTRVAENTPVDLDSPLEMTVNYWKNASKAVPAKLVLSRERLDFEEVSQKKKKRIFSIPAKELRKVAWPRTLAGTDPTFASYRIECAHDLKRLRGPRGKDFNLQLTLPQAVTLMRYVSDANAAVKAKTEGK